MKDLKTIEMFDSIPKFQTYSKYNTSLEKIFKGKWLKNLVDSLKHPRKVTKQGILEDITKKLPDDDEDELLYGNTINIKKDDQPKNLLEDNEEIIPSTKQTKHINMLFNNTCFTPRKKFNKPGLDPFKYNPNYNSIYKNTPCVKIKEDTCKNRKCFNNPFLTVVNSTKNFSISKNKSRNKGKKIFKYKTSIENKKTKNKSLTINNEIGKGERHNNMKTMKTLPVINKNKNNIYDKNNHALRFSKCISRKVNIYNVNKIVSYLQPYDYSTSRNKTIDFRKMLHRSEKNLINVSSLKVPSFYFYHPNYELIEQKPLRILFNEEENVKKNRNNKKFLMQKLWRSYDVKQEYQLVDNSKLNDDAVKLLNLNVK